MTPFEGEFLFSVPKKIYEFLFTAAPLNVERGSGAPINPVVLKATTSDSGSGGGTETPQAG